MAFHVLLVEPDAGLADEIRRAFAPLGFAVTALQAGEAALEQCKDASPDLILLAAELPDMSGFSVCNRLKRVASSVPLLLYTGEATDAAIEAHRATRTRADDYVKKPFEVADLLGRAAALLHTDQAGAPPPPVPPPVPGQRPLVQAGRMRPAAPARDPFQVLEDWPRDPAPPKGTPEQKLEYFRERLRARDAFLVKVREAIAEMKVAQTQLSTERDFVQNDLEQERAALLDAQAKLQEAAQDAAAQAARIEDLRRQLEESENTRQSLSDVLSETMQQHEAAEQQWSGRIAAADGERAKLEGEMAERAEAHARAVAALEADRADERARAEAARVAAEEAHAQALVAEREDRGQERAEAASKLQLAEERIAAVEAEREELKAELARQEEAARARADAFEQEMAERARAAEEEAAALRTRVDEANGRADALEVVLSETRARVAALEDDAARAAEARAALEEELRRARAEAKAYDEKAVAVEHAFHAKAAELAASEQRLRDLGAALDEGRASAKGTRGELARLDAARAEAERRATQLRAERDQLAQGVEAARREMEAAREETRAERERIGQLTREVGRLAKLEPIAEEAARLRKEVMTLRELVQQRTSAAESAARAAQAAAAERARAEERLAVEGGRLVAQVARLEQEMAGARRRAEELERSGGAREAALRRSGVELEEQRRALAAEAAESERRHGAEVTRLKAAMVDLERHLEARARSELQLKKRLQELERAVQARPQPAAADPAEVAKLKAGMQKATEEIEELRSENDFLNGEVARYVQKNKDLQAQVGKRKR